MLLSSARAITNNDESDHRVQTTCFSATQFVMGRRGVAGTFTETKRNGPDGKATSKGGGRGGRAIPFAGGKSQAGVTVGAS